MKSVIIPTLNEEENIGRLIDAIYSVLDPSSTAVIVVDDDSSDDTQRVVEDKSEHYPHVGLIVRKNERGLGSAVKCGAEAVDEDTTIVMDADFSHNPRFIPDMIQQVEEGYDVVVGSRYVAGGKIVGWPGSRKAVSQGATWIARLLLRVPLKDPMSGFVCVRSPAILRKGFDYADYKFGLEIVSRNRQLSVTEVPITFQDRTRGKSKLGSGTIFQYLVLVIRLLLGIGMERSALE
jgi:dolichol-phosphate mannosyltransferase